MLRDVNVFLKKHQVGEGTYGSVFVGQDKITKDIVALKRINTEQEENGFPITAIREVKILKALNHENIVTLKEIVTSKGEYKIVGPDVCCRISMRRKNWKGGNLSFAHRFLVIFMIYT